MNKDVKNFTMVKEKVDRAHAKSVLKIKRKMGKLRKKGKLKRHVIDKLNEIRDRVGADKSTLHRNIEDDVEDTAMYAEVDDDVLPMDMLDADIDWENSAFAKLKKRIDGKDPYASDEEGDRHEKKKRSFASAADDGKEEMLPIKLSDGTVVRQTRDRIKKEVESDEEEKEEENAEDDKKKRRKDEWKEEDYSKLSASELLVKRKEMLEEAKQTIASNAHQLLSNPQENITKLRDLLSMGQGDRVHSLIRERVQQLAMATIIQVLVDIIPGYTIRQMTEQETGGGKLKKETKKLAYYEESLLRYYLKFLQYCEKLIKHLQQKLSNWDESSFKHKMAILGMRAMCRLLVGCPHFNYAANIVTSLVRLTLTSHKQTVVEVCQSIATMFKGDVNLKMTLFGCKEICSLVNKKINDVPPELLKALLSLNIKEVSTGEEQKKEKKRLNARKYQIQQERKSKSARKYEKQIKKLEKDLKETEAAETISVKLKAATEAMKFVFQIYFSIVKRMPHLTLLVPVLEGLSKYAHLLNVEFFDDIIHSMQHLVDQKHLRLVDQLHCVNTVFVILAGEGSALNVDPFSFYRSTYRMLADVPFHREPEARQRTVDLVVKSLDLMINGRRKQVPLMRVAAFVRRLLCIAILMDDISALIITALVRSFFIAHPKLIRLVDEEEGEHGGGIAMFQPSLDDPDCCRALGSDVSPLLRILVRRQDPVLSAFADNILASVPSTGYHSMNKKYTTIKPWTLTRLEEYQGIEKVEDGAFEQVLQLAKKKKEKFSSKNVFSYTEKWVETMFEKVV